MRVSDAARGDGGGAPVLALLAQPLPADGRSVVCLDTRLATAESGAGQCRVMDGLVDPQLSLGQQLVMSESGAEQSESHSGAHLSGFTCMTYTPKGNQSNVVPNNQPLCEWRPGLDVVRLGAGRRSAPHAGGRQGGRRACSLGQREFVRQHRRARAGVSGRGAGRWRANPSGRRARHPSRHQRALG